MPVLQQLVFSPKPPSRRPLTLTRRWVAAQLEVDGEDLVGRFRGLDLLLAALACLSEPLGLATTADRGRTADGDGLAAAAAADAAARERRLAGAGAAAWWAARALLMQQHALSGRSATIQAALLAATGSTLEWVKTLSGQGVATRVAELLTAAARMEAALAYQAYGDVEAARRLLEQAGQTLGVEVGAVVGAE